MPHSWTNEGDWGMHISTSDYISKEKRIEIHPQNVKGLNSDSTLRSKPDASTLQKLLGASKEAEVLIACMFDLYSIAAPPLVEIWDRLVSAINEAQHALQVEHLNVPSALSRRMHRKRRL
jgi:hypothetical protein